MSLKKATQYGRFIANTTRLQLHLSFALVFKYNPYRIDLNVQVFFAILGGNPIKSLQIGMSFHIFLHLFTIIQSFWWFNSTNFIYTFLPYQLRILSWKILHIPPKTNISVLGADLKP